MKPLLTIFLLMLPAPLIQAVETYELRIYHLISEDAAQKWDHWMSGSGMAYFKNSGATIVGAFKSKSSDASESNTRYTLSVYPSIASISPINGALSIAPNADALAESYLEVPKEEPSFDRIDTSLLTAFPSFTRLVDPVGEGDGQRFFELRIYECHSERATALKVEMFGQGGELDIFEDTGLNGVFFGSARIAGNLPQLTYMLVHENENAAKDSWDRFRSSKAWLDLKVSPRYESGVSKIHKHVIEALPFSEIK